MKTFKDFLNEAAANSRAKNLSKSEIEDLPVGTDFYYNGYTAKKVSDSKVKIKYPMRSSVLVPIASFKESINEAVSVDREFMKISSMIGDVKNSFRDVARQIRKETDMPQRDYERLTDPVEDIIVQLRKEMDNAQTKLKKW